MVTRNFSRAYKIIDRPSRKARSDLRAAVFTNRKTLFLNAAYSKINL